MGTNLNGLIIDGRVYVADPEHSICLSNCALRDYCREIIDSYNSLCVIHGATESNDFGYRFSPELTEKLKGE